MIDNGGGGGAGGVSGGDGGCQKEPISLPSSAHPNHTTLEIPFSLAYRLRQVCSFGSSE